MPIIEHTSRIWIRCHISIWASYSNLGILNLLLGYSNSFSFINTKIKHPDSQRRVSKSKRNQNWHSSFGKSRVSWSKITSKVADVLCVKFRLWRLLIMSSSLDHRFTMDLQRSSHGSPSQVNKPCCNLNNRLIHTRKLEKFKALKFNFTLKSDSEFRIYR